MSLVNQNPTISLSQRVQASEYSARALSLIGSVRDASDPFDLCALLLRACTALGAHAGIYAHVVPEDERQCATQLALACDPALAYALAGSPPAGKALLEDPWLRYAAGHLESIVASQLPFHPGGEERQALLDQHGFRSALLLPTQGGGNTGRFGLLCLGSNLEGDFEAPSTHLCRVLAHSLAVELHEWWLTNSRTHLLRDARLRSLDLKLLAMERDGLGTKQIARTLGISEDSINSRFQRINAKLDSPNRKASALRAATHGLL